MKKDTMVIRDPILAGVFLALLHRRIGDSYTDVLGVEVRGVITGEGGLVKFIFNRPVHDKVYVKLLRESCDFASAVGLIFETPEQIQRSEEMPDNEVRQAIFQEIETERQYQDAKWGGPKHDDEEEGDRDFENYIAEYAFGSTERSSKYDHRTRMVKCAALAVAAIERFDRIQARDLAYLGEKPPEA